MVATVVLSAAILAQSTERWVERPFNGKDLTGWETNPAGAEHKWVVGNAVVDRHNDSRLAISGKGTDLVNLATDHGTSSDFYTKVVYGDIHLTLEVMVPSGSNSGIYVMGEYEVQVLDSYKNAKNPAVTDMGALYAYKAPFAPKYKKAGEWNTYDIKFHAPKFDSAGNKIKNAVFDSIKLNGKEIHKNLEMEKQTPGGLTGKERKLGPLLFQGNHGAVAFRNIRVQSLK